MPRQLAGRSGTMDAVPLEIQVRLVSGMRWTLWLSVGAIPFSYGTSILPARAGTEVIGTYGLLSLYIAVVSTLLYLGGDSVVIRFLPLVEATKRPAFLISYFLVVIAALAPWLAVATLWPRSLHYIFGEGGGRSFQLLILYLSPIYILFSLVVAALKAALAVDWAQSLFRGLTIASFVCYAVLVLC